MTLKITFSNSLEVNDHQMLDFLDQVIWQNVETCQFRKSSLSINIISVKGSHTKLQFDDADFYEIAAVLIHNSIDRTVLIDRSFLNLGGRN